MKVDVQDETELRWPAGWDRTLIQLRKAGPQWSKPVDYYRQKAIKELTMMGATAILISRAPVSQERMDPGVSIWFSMAKEDFSWQTMLELPPAPTLKEIETGFRQKARKVHPDLPGGGDIEMFRRLAQARNQAEAWVKGTHSDRHEFVMALDRYTAIRWNLAGLWRAFYCFRSLQRLGMPTILERVLDKAFKASLPMNASAENKSGGEP